MPKGIYIRTKEQLKRLSNQLTPFNFKKDNIPWNKGRLMKHTEEKKQIARHKYQSGLSIKNVAKEIKVNCTTVYIWCKDIMRTKSETAKGNTNGFKKGHKSWTKGKKGLFVPTQEWKDTLSKRMKGNKYCSGKASWNRGKKFKGGEGYGNWRGGISKLNYTNELLERITFRRTMQKLIFERDHYQCQICGSGGDLQVDHIASWAEFKELRFDPENCRTLCMKCHYKITFNKEMPETVKTWGHNLKKKELICQP